MTMATLDYMHICIPGHEILALHCECGTQLHSYEHNLKIQGDASQNLEPLQDPSIFIAT